MPAPRSIARASARCAMREGPDRRGRKAADAPGSSAPRFCRQNGRRLARQGLPKDPVREPGRPEARRQSGRAPSRSSATAVFKICARRGLFAARRRAARTCADGRRPSRTASTRSRSARHMGLLPLRCTPPLRMCRRPSQGAAWRSCRARRTPPAACRPCPWRIADSGAAYPPPPSALPAPSRPRRAGLFAGRRAPGAGPMS